MGVRTLSGLPAGEALARVANGYLESAAGACKHLSDPQDSEALHDFRVALRRLHSCLSLYPSLVTPVLSRRRLKRIRRLAKATNAARDAEVQIRWLQGQEALCAGEAAEACQRVSEALERQYATDRVPPAQALPPRFRRLQRKLDKPLARLARAPVKRTFAACTAAIALPLITALREGLSSVGAADDVEAAHRARIVAKRLRYLLTPLREEFEACERAVVELGRLQDHLGDLHDRHVFVPLLARTAAEIAAGRAENLFSLQAPPPRQKDWVPPGAAGFVQLFTHNLAVVETLYRQFRQQWLLALPTLEATLLAAVDALERGDAKGEAGVP